MSSKDHWEGVYVAKTDDQLSWSQSEPSVSLALIREACSRGSVIDMGGGASPLASRLLDEGYSVAVLDVSERALSRAKERMGKRASEIQWIVADVNQAPDLGRFDVWHDRALFHFLTGAAERANYAELLLKTIAKDRHAVVATFAEDGPEKCSGLPVCRYNGQELAKELGLRLMKNVREIHRTPWGASQSFQYSLLRRCSAAF